MDATYPLEPVFSDTHLKKQGVSSTKALARLASLSEFLCVGGATVLLAIAFLFMERVPALAPLGAQNRLGWFFVFLAPWINYPHAFWSYRLAYQQGTPFIAKHLGVLVLLPVSLVAALALSIQFVGVPVASVTGLLGLERVLNSFGVFLNFSLYGSLGAAMLAYLLIAQNIVLGRHYAMQSFGVTVHCAFANKYPLDESQRNLLRRCLGTVWVLNWFFGYTVFQSFNVSGFQYYSPRLPWFTRAVGVTFFLVILIRMAREIVWKNYRAGRGLPPASAVAALLSGFLWIQPFYVIPFGYAIWVAPFGHSLQYLYFCGLVEKNGFSRGWRIVGIAAAILTIGYVGFEGLPKLLDRYGVGSVMSIAFGALACGFVVNFHHYFIDGIVWRSQDSRVRSLLKSR